MAKFLTVNEYYTEILKCGQTGTITKFQLVMAARLAGYYDRNQKGTSSETVA